MVGPILGPIHRREPGISPRGCTTRTDGEGEEAVQVVVYLVDLESAYVEDVG